MSERLPTPGGDSGTWGDVLNGYLGVSLASDGTLNTGVVAAAQLATAAVGATALSSGAAPAGYVPTATGWGSATWAANTPSIGVGTVGATALTSGAATANQVPLATGWGSATWGSYTDAMLSTSDVTTNNVTSSKHGFAPKSGADATTFLNGAATPAFAAVKDSDLSTTDITTNNATSSKHGFLPKLDSSATKVFLGDGTYGLGALYSTNVQTSGYTVVTTDHAKIIEVSNAQGATITIPTNASQAFPVGSYFGVMQQGAGQVVFLAASGATILSPSSKLKLTGQYSSAAIRKQLTDTWILAGDITT